MAAKRNSGSGVSISAVGGGNALPQIRSNPITGSSVSAWGKSTSFQTTSQAAQLDLFYKKPGTNTPQVGNAGIHQQQIAQAALPASQQQYIGGSPMKGHASAVSSSGSPLNTQQREEMASMYATSIASAAVQNTGKRGAEGGYCFLAEWFDTSAQIVRKYNFFYFPIDTSVEMFDLKNKRTFLKRCPMPNMSLKDLHVGATVSVYGRQLKLIGYGDEYTRAQLENIKARTLALIRPEAYGSMGKIMDSITRHAGLSIGQVKLCKLTSAEAAAFTGSEQAGASLAGKPVVALEVIGKDVQAVLQSATGGDSKDSKSNGSGMTLKNVNASNSNASAAAELAFFFEQPRSSPALISNGAVTVLVIRPHAVAAGSAGQIIDTVLQAGFEITALQSFHLDRTAAEEFLEVYKGVLPEYSGLIEQMASGNSIALELIQHDAKVDAIEKLRALSGPIDPVIATHIRPNSLRARFGVNRVLNAVHCTDLPEDGPLESEFFFSILQKK